MSIKEQIRAEIERRRNEWLAKSRLIKKGRDVAMYAAGKSSAYAEFLSLLDSLPEQPVEGLEEEMDEIWLEYCEDVDYLVYASIARRFAEWGAEHLKR